MLVMNNGLKTVGTLDEIHYADSITADQEGHVAVTDSAGRLFLLKNGEILSSLTLEDEQETSRSCSTAAPSRRTAA